MTTPTDNQPNIMVVDDQPANVKLLEEMLEAWGCQVCAFLRGRLALAGAAKAPPDLVLLDINMPEMDGYEVCRRLKADAKLKDTPILFISARNETMDKVKAFSVGGVDYVTKPFQFEEVHARVRTHLKLRRLQQELEQHNAHLDELVRQRTRQLAEANDRLSLLDKAKSEFLGLISHELRTPLSGLFGVGQLLLAECPATPATEELAGIFQQSQRRLLTIIEDALLLTQIEVRAEQFSSAPVSLNSILCPAARNAADFAKSRGVLLGATPDMPDWVRGEPILLTKAVQALLETAVKFSQPDEMVRLSGQSSGNDVVVVIEARGRTIPAQALQKFFNVFSIGEPITPGGDLGLGPPVAERIIALFGGAVVVENQNPPGIRLKICFRSSEPRPRSKTSA